MARTRFVTRTINVTECTALCMDISNGTAVTKEFQLTGATYDNQKALKELQKLYQTEELAIVAVQQLKTHEEIYGMREVDFLKVATRMSDDRKFIETESEDE